MQQSVVCRNGTILLRRKTPEDHGSVRVLQLANNNLSHVAALRRFENLETLNLAFNALSSCEQLGNCNRLTNVNLNHNRIRHFRGLEASLARLKVLRCSYNRISSVAELQGCSALQELWIQHNQIESLQELHVLKRSPHLKFLVLKPNPCCRTPLYRSKLISILPQLTLLDGKEVLPEERQVDAQTKQAVRCRPVSVAEMRRRRPPQSKQRRPLSQVGFRSESVMTALAQLPNFESLVKSGKAPLNAMNTTKAKHRKSASKRFSKHHIPPPISAPLGKEFVREYTTGQCAVLIRTDGSACARWPGKGVAASIDCEGDGFRLFASYSSGELAMVFSGDGSGSITFPSGSPCLCVTTNNGGTWYSVNGTKCMSWDNKGSILQTAEGQDRIAVIEQVELGISCIRPLYGNESYDAVLMQDIKHRFERGVNEQRRTDLEKGDCELWKLLDPVRHPSPKEAVASNAMPEGLGTRSPSEAIADINNNLDRLLERLSSRSSLSPSTTI